VETAEPHVSTDALKRYYRDMLLIRRFEERAGQMYGMGLIGGFCHLYIGQEAVRRRHAGRLEKATRSSLPIAITAHAGLRHGPERRHGRLTGRRAGYSHGKGRLMHMFSREKNFFGGTALWAQVLSARPRFRASLPQTATSR